MYNNDCHGDEQYNAPCWDEEEYYAEQAADAYNDFVIEQGAK